MFKKDRTGPILAVMLVVIVVLGFLVCAWSGHRQQQQELLDLTAQWHQFHQIAFHPDSTTPFQYTERRADLKLFEWEYGYFRDNAKAFPQVFPVEKLNAFADSVLRRCCQNVSGWFGRWQPLGDTDGAHWYVSDLNWSAETLGMNIEDLGWTPDSLDRFFTKRIIAGNKAWYDSATKNGWPWLDDNLRISLRSRWQEARAALSEKALGASGMYTWKGFLRVVAPNVPSDVYHYHRE